MPGLAVATVAAASAGPWFVSSPAVAANTSSSPSPSGSDQFSIKIGDTVSPGRPSSRAGIIDEKGGKQSYSFVADAGAIVFVKGNGCQGALTAFSLKGPSNADLSGRIGCGDFGPTTLAQAGTYRIEVSTEHAAARYGFSLLATRFDQFTINIGDTVSPDRPSPGAGIIAIPGARQSFAFQANAGSVIYAKVGPCEGEFVSFDVRDPGNSNIGGRNGCGDFGPVTLLAAGTYHLLVNADLATSKFAFTLLPTRFDQYSIKIGDTVSPDHPAQGAGIITELGQRQSYAFDGKAGDAIYLGFGPCEGASPSFDLLKPDRGALELLANCHLDIGRQTLPVTGRYQIVAKTEPPNVKSRYGFVLRAVPPDKHFNVRLPLIGSSALPYSGAGHISDPGAQHLYDFTAVPGTVVHIESKCSCVGLSVRATSVGDTSRFGFWELNRLKNDWKVPEGGRYTIQVRSNGYTGDYAFTAGISQQIAR
jgi:hypothetical protein